MANTTNHPDTILTPMRAREALKCIADLSTPVPPDHWAIVALSEVLRQFGEALRGAKAHEETSCPGCQVARFIVAFTTDHLAHCPEHPAVRRARAVRDAIRLAPEVVRSLRLQPVAFDPARLAAIDALVTAEVPRWKGGWTFLRDASWLRHDVEFLTGPDRKKYPGQAVGKVTELEEAIEAWRRIVHRGSDPCPYCGAVVTLGEVMDHLLRCKRHPATVLADDGLAALAGSLGKGGAEQLVRRVLERNALVDGLRSLLVACDTFDGELGWNGEECYARGYVEKALERALAAATRIARVGEPEHGLRLDPVTEATSGPAFARPVWRALFRVATDGPTPGSHAGTDEDGALLRATYDEMLRLHEQLKDRQECPACGRHGIFTPNAVRHVAECLLHPAVSRERAAAAELQLAGAILEEKRPGQAVRETCDDRAVPLGQGFPNASWRSEARRRAQGRKYFEQSPPLDLLLSPERRAKYRPIVGEYRESLVRALSMWQLLVSAQQSECPFCGEAAPLEALLGHVVGCAAHPAAQAANVLERALQEANVEPTSVAARLRREADRARVAIVRLVECTERFRARFGDDDRGRATVSRSLQPAFSWERHVAKRSAPGARGRTVPGDRAVRLALRPLGDLRPQGRRRVLGLLARGAAPDLHRRGLAWLSLVDALFADLLEHGWSHKTLASAKVEGGGLAIRLDGMKPPLQARVDQVRAESFRVCERCGAPGTLRTPAHGKLRMRCDACEAAETVH